MRTAIESIRRMAYFRGLMRLGRVDFEAILDFLARVDDLDTDDPYPTEVLASLRALIPCDSAQYEEADLEARRFIDDDPLDSDALYWAVGPCPITDYRARTGDLTAVRMSDVIGRGRYHELPIYRQYYQPVGLDHILELGLSAARQRYRSLVLMRGHDVADFTERDRAVLEMLRPHLRAREALAGLQRRARETDGHGGPADAPDDPQSSLTAREREILRLVGEGRTNPQIAAELWITPATVKKHLEHSYEKLGVAGRAAAATAMQARSGG
jgi:DNA-binding CsgD family transcriptional regulator